MSVRRSRLVEDRLLNAILRHLGVDAHGAVVVVDGRDLDGVLRAIVGVALGTAVLLCHREADGLASVILVERQGLVERAPRHRVRARLFGSGVLPLNRITHGVAVLVEHLRLERELPLGERMVLERLLDVQAADRVIIHAGLVRIGERAVRHDAASIRHHEVARVRIVLDFELERRHVVGVGQTALGGTGLRLRHLVHIGARLVERQRPEAERHVLAVLRACARNRHRRRIGHGLGGKVALNRVVRRDGELEGIALEPIATRDDLVEQPSGRGVIRCGIRRVSVLERHRRDGVVSIIGVASVDHIIARRLARSIARRDGRHHMHGAVALVHDRKVNAVAQRVIGHVGLDGLLGTRSRNLVLRAQLVHDEAERLASVVLVELEAVTHEDLHGAVGLVAEEAIAVLELRVGLLSRGARAVDALHREGELARTERTAVQGLHDLDAARLAVAEVGRRAVLVLVHGLAVVSGHDVLVVVRDVLDLELARFGIDAHGHGHVGLVRVVLHALGVIGLGRLGDGEVVGAHLAEGDAVERERICRVLDLGVLVVIVRDRHRAIVRHLHAVLLPVTLGLGDGERVAVAVPVAAVHGLGAMDGGIAILSGGHVIRIEGVREERLVVRRGLRAVGVSEVLDGRLDDSLAGFIRGAHNGHLGVIDLLAIVHTGDGVVGVILSKLVPEHRRVLVLGEVIVIERDAELGRGAGVRHLGDATRPLAFGVVRHRRCRGGIAHRLQLELEVIVVDTVVSADRTGSLLIRLDRRFGFANLIRVHELSRTRLAPRVKRGAVIATGLLDGRFRLERAIVVIGDGNGHAVACTRRTHAGRNRRLSIVLVNRVAIHTRRVERQVFEVELNGVFALVGVALHNHGVHRRAGVIGCP